MREFLALIKKWMTRLLAGIATVLLSIMTLLVLYQVFTRYILNSPAAFYRRTGPLFSDLDRLHRSCLGLHHQGAHVPCTGT